MRATTRIRLESPETHSEDETTKTEELEKAQQTTHTGIRKRRGQSDDSPKETKSSTTESGSTPTQSPATSRQPQINRLTLALEFPHSDLDVSDDDDEEDEDEENLHPEAYVDPIQWFNAMPPRPLRQCQQSFKKGNFLEILL